MDQRVTSQPLLCGAYRDRVWNVEIKARRGMAGPFPHPARNYGPVVNSPFLTFSHPYLCKVLIASDQIHQYDFFLMFLLISFPVKGYLFFKIKNLIEGIKFNWCTNKETPCILICKLVYEYRLPYYIAKKKKKERKSDSLTFEGSHIVHKYTKHIHVYVYLKFINFFVV